MEEDQHHNEIILYQPDSTLSLDVRVENETVWLTQAQMATLFDKDQSVIARHIQNAFKEEVEKESNMQILHNTLSRFRPTTVYSLDVIISVGYRVKSTRGVQFRKWANNVLKDYLLKGYVVNQRIERLEYRVAKAEEKIDFFVKTSIPPKEGIFFDGQIFDAYTLVSDLIRSAKTRIVLIDNYADDSVLKQLDKRGDGVKATIFSPPLNKTIIQDIKRHNAQYPAIMLKTYHKAHDRFLIVDDEVFHIGASLKDLGKKLFAFSKMEALTADELIARLK